MQPLWIFPSLPTLLRTKPGEFDVHEANRLLPHNGQAWGGPWFPPKHSHHTSSVARSLLCQFHQVWCPAKCHHQHQGQIGDPYQSGEEEGPHQVLAQPGSIGWAQCIVYCSFLPTFGCLALGVSLQTQHDHVVFGLLQIIHLVVLTMKSIYHSSVSLPLSQISWIQTCTGTVYDICEF